MNDFAATLEDLHWRDLEEEWRDAVPRPNDFELLQMFPAALPFLKRKRKEILDGVSADNDRLTEAYRACVAESYRSEDGRGACPLGCGDRVTREFAKFALEAGLVDLDEDIPPDRLSIPGGRVKGKELRLVTLRRIEKLLRVDKMMRAPKGADRITPEDVARAKAFPIEHLIDVQRRDGFTCCPFHGEKTPSMKVYRKENRWWCYGACNAGGDVIDFLMRSEHIEFIPAVRKILGR